MCEIACPYEASSDTDPSAPMNVYPCSTEAVILHSELSDVSSEFSIEYSTVYDHAYPSLWSPNPTQRPDGTKLANLAISTLAPFLSAAG